MTGKTKAEKHQDHVERTARALYQNRELTGTSGNAQSDWETAEKIVHSPLRTTLFAINSPLIKLRHLTSKTSRIIAWDIPRWFLFSLPNLEWVKLLAVPLTIAAASSIITGQIQREANQNTALEEYFNQLEKLTFEQKLLSEKPQDGAIVLARGRTVAALRELDLPRKTQLIAFLQASGLLSSDKPEVEPIISFRGQNLSGLDLKNIDLSQVDFRETKLRRANLERTFLSSANLEEAFLTSANLKRAALFFANLEGASLYLADLERAYLSSANLKEAHFESANLKGAHLDSANLEGASLYLANLEGAFLTSANLKGVERLTQEQLTLAKLCRTVLPDDITLDPNRDCEELGIDPTTGNLVP